MGELGSLTGPAERTSLDSLLFELFPDFVAVGDMQGVLWRTSHSAARALGYETHELAGFPYRDLVHPSDHPILEASLARVMAGEAVSGILLRVVRKDGRCLWIEKSVAPLAGGSRFLCVGRDITERKTAEERLQKVLESVPDALLGLDEKRRLLWMNRCCERLINAERSQWVGQSLEAILVPVQDGVLSSLECGLQFDAEVPRTVGGPLPVEVAVEDGRATGCHYLVSLRDARRRRRAEEQLDVAESALEESHQGYWIRDASAGALYASEETYRILGCAPPGPEECKTLLERVHPEDRPRLEDALLGLSAEELQPSFVTEFRVRGSDGGERLVRLHGRVCRDQDGRPHRTMGTVQDITARHQIEASLQQERDLNAAILDTTGALMLLLDREGRIVRFNHAAQRLTGYRFEEVLGRHPWDFLVPTVEVGAVKANFERWLEGRFRGECTSHWQTREGKLHLIVWSDSGVKNQKGEVEFVICTGIDVTGLREAERQLAEAEERNRRLVDLAFDIVLLECDQRITEINPAGAAMLGAEPAQLCGRPVVDVVHPDHRASMQEQIRRSVEEQRETPLTEQKLLRHDGSVLEVEVAAIPVAHEGCPGTLIVFRDISERKRAEAALRAREHHFQTLAKVAPVGIYEADRDGELIYVNQRCIGITGLSYQEILGGFWQRHVHPVDREGVLERWQRCIREGLQFRVEYRFVRPDGGITWVLNQATTERDTDGEVLGFVGTLTDITEDKNNEEELRKYREELEQRVAERTSELAAVNQELEAFSYSVSHDLRAPLRAINGFGAALWEDYHDRLDEQGRYFLSRMRSNTEWMAQLIDGILELSRLSQQPLERRTVDLTALARAVLSELRTAEPQREVECHVAADLSVQGDERMLRVLLQNLLGNAWKYTARQPHAQIAFDVVEESGRRIYYVQDNGVGFEPTQAARLFRAFQRLHTSTDFEGTGIGLATVQRIVQRHGGTVWAKAEPSQGATFYFTLQ